ncbi:MAG: hypothetical protein GX889_12145 [Clostridiales bacterium]|nr:hypothetical protein [Clostridiales bacterium]
MFQLFKLSLLKQFWEIKNNRFRLVFGVFANIFFVVFFYYNIAKKNSTNILGIDYLTFILIYAILWLVLSSFSHTSNIVVNEAKIGTIEQLIISPYGIKNIVLIRLIIQSLISISFITVVLLISNILTQNMYNLHIGTFIITITIGIFSLYGIGLILTSISLLTKEINLLLAIVKIAVLYIIIKFDANILIPFSYAKSILTELILNNKSLSVYPLGYLIMFVLNSLLFFLFGVFCFKYVEKIALKKGNITGY